MKKAKLTLTAIAIIGLVGGAMAFKAKHFGSITHLGSTCKFFFFTCSDDLVEVNYTTIPNENPFMFQNAQVSGTGCVFDSDCKVGTILYNTAD